MNKRPKIEVASYKGRRYPRWLKRLLAAVLALAAAGVLAFAVLLGLVLSGAHDDVDGDPRVMIVLGCQVREDGPSVLLRDRLEEALDYWEGHPDITIVVSGGQGPNEPTTEARAMADYLMEGGVAEDQILLEGDSHNTAQNLRLSMAVLEEAGADLSGGVILVSNGFHLTRARMLAERFGLENVSTLAAPTSHTLSRLQMYIREPIALVKSFLLDR